MPQILKYIHSSKTKSKCLEKESFFLQIRKFIDYTSNVTIMAKNYFLA